MGGVLITVKNGICLRKINKTFYEIVYVIKGANEIVTDNKKAIIRAGEFYRIEHGDAHQGQSEYAEMIVVCTPPFDL